MPVVSVDLTCRNWSDLGVVCLEHRGPHIHCELVNWTDESGTFPPPVVELALRLNTLCAERAAGVLMLDGPQAWKEEAGSFEPLAGPSRPASASSNQPIPYERFVGYCLALYDALGRLGWRRMAAMDRSPNPGETLKPGATRKTLVESYPQAAWKSLGIQPLPARRLCRVSDLAETYAALTAVLPLSTNRPPNHSQLQAIAGGLPGLAIASDIDGERAIQPAETNLWTPPQHSPIDGGRWHDSLSIQPITQPIVQQIAQPIAQPITQAIKT
jgi:hypothetical protein